MGSVYYRNTVCVCVCLTVYFFLFITLWPLQYRARFIRLCGYMSFLNDKLMRKERKKYDSRERQKCKHADSLKYIGDARYLHISYYLDQVRFERVLIRDSKKF